MSSDAGLLHGPFWGVSARVLLPALLVEAAGAVCTVWAPDLFSLGLLPRYVWFVLGCLLFVAGGVCIRQARHEVRRSIRDGTFPSEGLYRYTRNPMEAGWIFGILPGGGTACRVVAHACRACDGVGRVPRRRGRRRGHHASQIR